MSSQSFSCCAGVGAGESEIFLCAVFIFSIFWLYVSIFSCIFSVMACNFGTVPRIILVGVSAADPMAMVFIFPVTKCVPPMIVDVGESRLLCMTVLQLFISFFTMRSACTSMLSESRYFACRFCPMIAMPCDLPMNPPFAMRSFPAMIVAASMGPLTVIVPCACTVKQSFTPLCMMTSPLNRMFPVLKSTYSGTSMICLTQT